MNIDEKPWSPLITCEECGYESEIVRVTSIYREHAFKIAMCGNCEHPHDWHHEICSHDVGKWGECSKCNNEKTRYGTVIDFTDWTLGGKIK